MGMPYECVDMTFLCKHKFANGVSGVGDMHSRGSTRVWDVLNPIEAIVPARVVVSQNKYDNGVNNILNNKIKALQ